MRRLILKMSVSIDGFVGGPNGEIDWLLRSLDEGSRAWTLETLWEAGVHIMGSRTFYDMASYWPYSTDPLASPMNEIPKVIFSKKGRMEPINRELTTAAFRDASIINPLEPGSFQSPNAFTWSDAKLATGDLEEELKVLKLENGKDILAHGGAGFAQSLVKSGQVDEYRLLVHPVVLGQGLPLFSKVSKPMDLKLLKSITFNNGAIANLYRPA
jgi:dihydrofolate reductase